MRGATEPVLAVRDNSSSDGAARSPNAGPDRTSARRFWGPPTLVRRAVHMAGYRFRLHRSDLPGKPDLVFLRHRLPVFVHGCFWHRHGCGKTTMPATNTEFWYGKFRRTVEGDRRALKDLERVHTIAAHRR